jgi:energy-coupling factor transporter ATP-binding protein EcfA2
VIVIVQHEDQELRLRALVEELSEHYVLFSRVELNVVVDDGRPLDIDRALAPLLPRCRSALKSGTVVGSEVLGTLASELRASVVGLDGVVDGELRERAAEIALGYAERLASIVAPSTETQPPPLFELDRVELLNFRAFAEQVVPVRQFTLIEGLNGTGKSSLFEALEILWAGSSQRKPADESAESYDRHVTRNGQGSWRVRGHLRDVDSGMAEVDRDRTDGDGAVGLPRNVFSQDGSVDIASEPSSRRYAQLLSATGLAVPELISECERLNREARDDLNRVLSKLSLGPVRANSRGVDAVRTGLASLGVSQYPKTDALDNAETRLADVAASAGFQYRRLALQDGTPLLQAVEEESVQAAALLVVTDAFKARAAEAQAFLESISKTVGDRAEALEGIAASLANRESLAKLPAPKPEITSGSPLPRRVASTLWNVTESLRITLDELRSQRLDDADRAWRDRVQAFIAKAQDAIDAVPRGELEGILKATQDAPPQVVLDKAPLPVGQLELAGLVIETPSEVPPAVVPAALETARSLRDYESRLQQIARQIQQAPLVRLDGNEDDLHHALAQFEVARGLKAPVGRAQEQLLARLLSGPLEPLLSELIAALTRFEWYFHPLRMNVRRGSIELRGLATDSEDLDVRMLLNAGERAIVSLAWFLALYVLQPAGRRSALLLDDPFSTLDENNRAALLATLRTLTRLTRPATLAISTHDRITADALEREFGAVDGWPSEVAHLWFARSPDGTTRVEPTLSPAAEADVESEVTRLGLTDVESGLATPERR